MSFNPNDLKKVYSESSEKEQKIFMSYLKEYIDNLCKECESDRMTNVLAPKCRRRFLITTRILAGSVVKSPDFPKFCYSQVVLNLKRYMEKKTTIYYPIDTLIFNEDFLELFFNKTYKTILNLIEKQKFSEIKSIIDKSKLPAIYSKTRKDRPGILKNILRKDTYVREDSFIYDFNEEYFIIWFNNTLYVSNFQKGYTICNVHKEKIVNISILKMILPIYAEGKEFIAKLENFEGKENEFYLKILIPNEILVRFEDDLMNQKIIEITNDLRNFSFPKASFRFEKKFLEIDVDFDENTTYDDLNNLFNTIGNLSNIENINLLKENK